MNRYMMFVLMIVVFVIGSGCDSAVSSMEEGRDGLAAAGQDAGADLSGLGAKKGKKKRGKAEDGARTATMVATGMVEAVGADFVRVLGIDYFVVAQTVIVDLKDQPVSLADLSVGVVVKVEAVQRPDESWEARYIVVAGTPATISAGDDAAFGKRSVVSSTFVTGDVVGLEPLSSEWRGETAAQFAVSNVVDDGRNAQGTLLLKKSTGAWYQADIRHLQIDADGTASFSGPVTASNPAFLVPVWIYVRVRDGVRMTDDVGDAFVYQVGAPPEAGAEDILPNENGITLQITRGDIVVSRSASSFSTW